MTDVSILPNPSFEIDKVGWNATSIGTTLTQTNDGLAFPGSGTGSGLWTRVSGGPDNMILSVAPVAQYPALPGQVWSAGAHFQHYAGFFRQLRIDIRFHNAAGTDIGGLNGFSSTLMTSNLWQQIVMENVLAPALTAFVSMRLVATLTENGDAIRVDAFQLVNSDTLPAYVEPEPGTPGPNMITNSSFEREFKALHEHVPGGTDWEGNPVEARNRVQVVDAVHGDWVLELSNPDGRAVVNVQSEDAQFSACVEGDVLVAAASMRKIAGTSTFRVRLDAQFFDAADEPITGSAAVGSLDVPGVNWYRMITRSRPAPVGTTHAQVRINMDDATFGDVIQVDAVSLQKGLAPSAYAPNPYDHELTTPWIPATAIQTPARRWLDLGVAGLVIWWWDGAALQEVTMLGWWDGSEVQPAELLGWWDGAELQPLT